MRAASNSHRGDGWRVLEILGHGLRALVMLAVIGWGVLALHFALPGPRSLVVAVTAAWAAIGAAALIAPWLAGRQASRSRWHGRSRPRRRPLVLVVRLTFVLALIILVTWWQGLEPRNDRDWAPDVARQLSVERDGDRITLHNVRDFEWQTPSTAIPRWETRNYDLSQLDAVDMVVSYWMGPAIAHTLVTFGFTDGRHLTFSVEIRRERNEAFSISGGFFKQFELNLIAADENDILRLRSNVRGEDVYLYRVGLSPQARRELFLAYLDEAERLRQTPEFYNTLTSNCTTIVFDMVTRIVAGLPRDARLILSGYLPEYVYDIGGLDTSHPLEFLRSRGYINPRARQIPYTAGSEAFSRAIRDGVPAADGGILHASSP
ncbi:Lnb N-terminal periplasmic domain-containing protein [Salinicola halophyticus]|uniref:Lnb N-terminal periplasmic domain-containing protein n=1 Tax=Salinicola halophyticus TaxID=1808881 RepID=UPI003F48A08A